MSSFYSQTEGFWAQVPSFLHMPADSCSPKPDFWVIEINEGLFVNTAYSYRKRGQDGLENTCRKPLWLMLLLPAELPSLHSFSGFIIHNELEPGEL